MEVSGLLLICVSAFIAVFIILSLIAVVMRVIILLFPERDFMGDTALVAAITSAIYRLYPATKITKIEESK
jgi:hypothetical protein